MTFCLPPLMKSWKKFQPPATTHVLPATVRHFVTNGREAFVNAGHRDMEPDVAFVTGDRFGLRPATASLKKFSNPLPPPMSCPLPFATSSPTVAKRS